MTQQLAFCIQQYRLRFFLTKVKKKPVSQLLKTRGRRDGDQSKKSTDNIVFYYILKHTVMLTHPAVYLVLSISTKYLIGKQKYYVIKKLLLNYSIIISLLSHM